MNPCSPAALPAGALSAQVDSIAIDSAVQSGRPAVTDTCLPVFCRKLLFLAAAAVLIWATAAVAAQVSLGCNPPERPVILYPPDNEVSVELNLKLEADDFHDPDPGDHLARSLWRIQRSDNKEPVLDIELDKGDLTALQVPDLVLDPDTDYTLQVRYFDQNGEASPWSGPVRFTTETVNADQDNDGIPDSQEVADSVDLNHDGVPDGRQSGTIKSMNTSDGMNQAGVSVTDPSGHLETATEFDRESMSLAGYLLSPEDLPFGLVACKIKVARPGAEILYHTFFSSPLPSSFKWFSCVRSGSCSDVTAELSIDPDRMGVKWRVLDGGPDDADGVANGYVVAVSGPVRGDAGLAGEGSPPAADSGGGSGGGGCFIDSLN